MCDSASSPQIRSPIRVNEADIRAALAALQGRSLVLTGLMGAGKTTVGLRLARRLALPFVDADTEIEKAAGETVAEIFRNHGEACFRSGERRVIARLLSRGPQVLATGGGAFVDPDTRKLVKEKGLSVWLRAGLDVLVQRVSRRNTRPLLSDGDPRVIMERLMQERYPLYAEADIEVDSVEGPHDTVVSAIIGALARGKRKTGETCA